MNDLQKIFRDKMSTFGKYTSEKFLGSEIAHDWDKLVDSSIAAQVKPVTLEHGVLFVSVKSSAFKDQLKFFAEEIVDAINDAFGQGEVVVKSIRIAHAFQVADMPPEKNSAPEVVKSKVTLEQIILSDEEIRRCEEQAKKFSDEKLRQTVLQTLLAQAKSQKLRLANGWHKCANCDTLCEPQETFCETCKIREREVMVKELFKIFYDEPWLKPPAAQKILLERLPHMRTECSLDAVESARTSLIQKIAGRIRFGDEESPDVLKLVALEKRLPPEKLTPAIIRRTLIDLQFNLSEQPKLQRYLSKAQGK